MINYPNGKETVLKLQCKTLTLLLILSHVNYQSLTVC